MQRNALLPIADDHQPWRGAKVLGLESDPTCYRIPDRDEITLTPALAKEIRSRFRADRDNRFRIYLLAAGMRDRYLNPKTKAYTPEFRAWYEQEELEKLFGKLESSFVRYASAGNVVAYIANPDIEVLPAGVEPEDPTSRLEQLPLSVGTLYELSKILSDDPEVFDLCFTYKPRRANTDTPRVLWDTRGPALIHPEVSEADVKKWRADWLTPPQPKEPRSDKRTLLLGAITVSGELFDFDRKTGDKVGAVDLPEVEEFLAKLNAMFAGDSTVQFRLMDNMDYLNNGYISRRDKADPARKILEKSAPKSKPKKGAKSKKPKPLDLKKLKALDLTKVTGFIA